LLASPGAEKKPHTDGYGQQKLAYLGEMKHFIEEERSAIEALDLEMLDEVLNRKDALREEIDRFDQKQEQNGGGSLLTEHEIEFIVKTLEELSRMENENHRLLLDKREIIFKELKAVRTKKSARKAYGGTKEQSSILSESR